MTYGFGKSIKTVIQSVRRLSELVTQGDLQVRCDREPTQVKSYS